MSYIVGLKVENKTVKNVLSEATILHNGWELDNEAWAVEFTDGTRGLLTTSNGGFYIAKKDEFESKLQETQDSADAIKNILQDVKT